MRPLLVLLAAILTLLAGDTAPERPPTVMLVAVPAPAPTPDERAIGRAAAPEPCAPARQPALLSIAPMLEPRWNWQYSEASSTGTAVPGCAQSAGTWSPFEHR